MVKSTTQISPDATEPELTISPEKVCFLVIKAREFDAKELPNDTDPGSNPSDDQDIEVLEDQPDDPVVEEIDLIDRVVVAGRADRSGGAGVART